MVSFKSPTVVPILYTFPWYDPELESMLYLSMLYVTGITPETLQSTSKSTWNLKFSDLFILVGFAKSLESDIVMLGGLQEGLPTKKEIVNDEHW